MTAEDEQIIRSLADDLPAIWIAETTPPADRQRIARLLLERVVVTVDKNSEKVAVQLHWIGGQVRSYVVSRPVSGYHCRSDYPRLVERLRAMSQERLPAAEIAQRLNAEGSHPPRKAKQFNSGIILHLMAQLGLPRRSRYGTSEGLGPNEYRPMGLARRLHVSRDRLRRWQRNGWVRSRRDGDGHHVLWADADELRRLRELGRCLEAGESGPRVEKLKKPKRRAAK